MLSAARILALVRPFQASLRPISFAQFFLSVQSEILRSEMRRRTQDDRGGLLVTPAGRFFNSLQSVDDYYMILTGSMSIITERGGMPCSSEWSASCRKILFRQAREVHLIRN